MVASLQNQSYSTSYCDKDNLANRWHIKNNNIRRYRKDNMTRILVVDDNQDILAALEMLLEIHDYQVVTASNAQQAMAAVMHQKLDVVIQDMNFSQGLTQGSEGKSLFYQIKEAAPELPIIIITAWTQLETAVELVKQGAADYLPKPWDDEKTTTNDSKIST